MTMASVAMICSIRAATTSGKPHDVCSSFPSQNSVAWGCTGLAHAGGDCAGVEEGREGEGRGDACLLLLMDFVRVDKE